MVVWKFTRFFFNAEFANGTVNKTTGEQVSTNERIVCREAAEQDEAVGDPGAQEVKPHRG